MHEPRRDIAEIYDTYFVPALFEQWTERVIDAAAVRAGSRTLDVATGTGVLARALIGRVGDIQLVTGIDSDPGMLEVARRRAPGIQWQEASAESLPFASDCFDAVVSQFGLMFFQDRVAALREMMRILRPGGCIALAVWDRLERSPGFAALVELLHRVCGRAIADRLRVPFSLGDIAELRALCESAGMRRASITTHAGVARFTSIRSWIFTNINGSSFGSQIDPAQFPILMQQAERALTAFTTADGSVELTIGAHIVATHKR
jgi:ubiquinone/menaquinone biosynthesis C-methylase UbiE